MVHQEDSAIGLALTIIVLAIPFASLSSTNSNKSEQRPDSEKRHTSQKKMYAAELATLEVGTVREKPPMASQVPEEVKPLEKIKHPQKEKAQKRKAPLRQQDRQVQSGLIPELGIPKEELGMTGKLTTVTKMMGSEKGKARSQDRHSSDIPNKEVSNVVIETLQGASKAKATITSPSQQSLGPPGKEPLKGSKKPCASHTDLAEEDTKMKNQPYPRVKIEEDPEESKLYAECAIRCIMGKRMFVFTDGGSCAQASSAAFTYICLPEGQAEWQGHWHDESYGIIGDIRSREAEMIALTKALEVVEMEAKRQVLDAESPLRVFVFTDSRDSLYFCQAISTNGRVSSASRSLAKDNVSRALEGMINRMQYMKSTVKLELHWVKGHSIVHHNKRADKLATSALHAVNEHIQNTKHGTARDSRGYDLITFTDMEQQSKKVIAQRARAIGQELQKEMRIVTQRQIDTMVAFQARLEAQTRAVEPAMGVINRLVTIKDSGLDDLHPETIAVTSQRSPRGTKTPGDKPIDVASVVWRQTTEHYAQGIATEKQRYTGESPGPMGKEKIGELADENVTQKRLRRSRQAGLVFLRISKSFRAWFR
ncbi:hypothetical protein PG993_010709 [Apiospora rasikravindrae]|uniref:RNase H type-1 domain-containing protein n=1 Tax=Apiospora rasikravindrae TaxID=990691 RepID=A0ABR1SCB2_9PEZI